MSIVASLIFIFVGFLAGRSEAAVNNFQRDSYRDIRMLGRGNAGVADVSGGVSAFYNPAALAVGEGFSFIPLDTSFGGNQNIGTSITELTSLTDSSQTLSARFSPLLGKPLGLQGTFFPHVAIPGFMLGFYDYFDSNLEYQDPVFPQLDILGRNDWGLIMGAGTEVIPHVKIGFSLRYMRRKVIDESLSMASVGNLNSSYLSGLIKKGEAFGVNVGLLVDHPVNANMGWSVGLAVEDVGFTTFRNSDRSPLPGRQMQKINAGAAYKLKLKGGGLKLLFDMKELGDASKSYSKKIFTGFELEVPTVILRGGLFQGYWTAGVTVTAIPFFDLDITTYSEELGSAAGVREARYWMVGFRTGLDLLGKKKKKQRFTLDHL